MSVEEKILDAVNEADEEEEIPSYSSSRWKERQRVRRKNEATIDKSE